MTTTLSADIEVYNLLELTHLTAAHALALRQLVGALDTIQVAPIGCKAIMLAALRAAEIDILTTFAHVAVDEYDAHQVCGMWTLHDLIGHLADWDRYFVNWLASLRGERPDELYWDNDGDRFNEYLQQQHKGESWMETWRDFRAQRVALLNDLARVSDADFMYRHPSDAGMPFPSIYHCAWSALEHYLDHAAGVRRTLALALPEGLLHFHGPYTD